MFVVYYENRISSNCDAFLLFMLTYSIRMNTIFDAVKCITMHVVVSPGQDLSPKLYLDTDRIHE